MTTLAIRDRCRRLRRGLQAAHRRRRRKIRWSRSSRSWMAGCCASSACWPTRACSTCRSGSKLRRPKHARCAASWMSCSTGAEDAGPAARHVRRCRSPARGARRRRARARPRAVRGRARRSAGAAGRRPRQLPGRFRPAEGRQISRGDQRLQAVPDDVPDQRAGGQRPVLARRGALRHQAVSRTRCATSARCSRSIRTRARSRMRCSRSASATTS